MLFWLDFHQTQSNLYKWLGMQRHDWSSTSPKEPMLHLSLSPCTGYQLQLASSSRHWCDACIKNNHRLITHLLPLTITNLHPLQKPRLLPLTITNLHPLQKPRLLPLTITNLHPLQKPRLLPLTITNLHPLQKPRLLPLTITNLHPLQKPRLLPLTITNLHPLQKPRLLPLTITNLHPLQKPRRLPLTITNRGTITDRLKITLQNILVHRSWLLEWTSPPSGPLDPCQSSSNNWKLISFDTTWLHPKLKIKKIHISLYLFLLPLLACTYLKNARDLVLWALPLSVSFKMNRFMYSPIVSHFG